MFKIFSAHGLLPYRVRIRALEAFSATLAIYWGILLLLPVHTFSASPSYRVMAALASESAWGAYFLAAGLTQWVSVYSRNVGWLRPLGFHLAILGWGFASLMFFTANPYTHAPGIYGILAISQIIGAVWCRS